MPRLTEVLVLGANGMLGQACLRAFGETAVGRDMDDFDLAVCDVTLKEIRRLRPRLVINCAAATDVDRCETDHEYADRGNTLAAKHAAEAAAAVSARLMHVSTDFVFAGDKATAYGEVDTPRPINHYGLSKLAGERAVRLAAPDALVVRTSWLYGQGGNHFPGKVLQWAQRGTPLRIVDDQTGSPTYAEDLAAALRTLAGHSNASGIFHMGGAGCVTRLEWARETLALAGLNVQVLPASSADFPLPAQRPVNSCLDCTKAAGLGVKLPPWRDGLARYLGVAQGA